MKKFLCSLCSLIMVELYSVTADMPLVTSNVGQIRGLPASDGDYDMFLGIPYGIVDKNNPFGLSTPYPKFEETFDAFDDSIMCPQRDEFNKTLIGSLDCLTLNIYVPTVASSSKPLAVLIFIFGGALQFGSAGRYIFGPKFLVKHDIILVTLNHRLGPYGFMCLDNPKVPGNQGIKDQRLALRWIKYNIEAFGGDANKITFSGQSAGSMSVDLHIHSQNEENLFQQAILESGTVLTPFLFVNPREEGPLKMAKYLGLNTDDVNKALSFLVTVDTNDVIAAAEKTNLTFKVCVEKRFNDVEPIVNDYPINLAPKVKNISILTGFNSEEELRTYGNVDANYIKDNDLFKKYIEAFFDFGNCTYDEMKTVLRHFYFGDKKVDIETRQEIINLASDFQGNYPVLRSIRKYLRNGAKSIFAYLFAYVGDRNYVKYKHNITIGGAAHGDEIGYLYDPSFLQSFMSDEDRLMIEIMTTLWSNFVKFGNPTPEATDLLPVTWDPVTDKRWNYLLIDTDTVMDTRPYCQRMTFLDVFFKANRNYQIGYRDNKTCFVCKL